VSKKAGEGRKALDKLVNENLILYFQGLDFSIDVAIKMCRFHIELADTGMTVNM
jgi:hypothetical protein